jgi:hypothetical protein
LLFAAFTEKQLYGVGLAVPGGPYQGGGTSLVSRLDVRSPIEQDCYCLRVIHGCVASSSVVRVASAAKNYLTLDYTPKRRFLR